MLKLLDSDKIIQRASNCFSNLSDKKQKTLKQELNNGRAILNSIDQMNAYLHFYGSIHRQKLLRTFAHLPEYVSQHRVSVIDWGCGQGLAPIILNEYFEKDKGFYESITDVVLIEPSVNCLNRAVGNITWALPQSLLTYINKIEEDVMPDDMCIQEDIIIHVLSNVVDMPEFTGNGIRRFLKRTSESHHILAIVSPFYPKEGRGKRIDDFCNSVEGFENVYSFQKHVEDWNNTYSCQIRILANHQIA